MYEARTHGTASTLNRFECLFCFGSIEKRRENRVPPLIFKGRRNSLAITAIQLRLVRLLRVKKSASGWFDTYTT
jgi:hypothetical protein